MAVLVEALILYGLIAGLTSLVVILYIKATSLRVDNASCSKDLQQLQTVHQEAQQKLALCTEQLTQHQRSKAEQQSELEKVKWSRQQTVDQLTDSRSAFKKLEGKLIKAQVENQRLLAQLKTVTGDKKRAIDQEQSALEESQIVRQQLKTKEQTLGELQTLWSNAQSELNQAKVTIDNLDKNNATLQERCKELATESAEVMISGLVWLKSHHLPKVDSLHALFEALENCADTQQAEIHSLQASWDITQQQLKEQIEQRARESQHMHEQVEHLNAQLSEAANMCTQLTGRLKVLEDERDSVVADRDAVQADRDAARADLDALCKEHNALAAVLAQATSERDHVKAELGTVNAELAKVNAELDKVKAELAKVNAEQDKIKAELAKINAERDKVKADLDTATDELEEVKAELVKVSGECNEVKLELDTVKARQGEASTDEGTQAPVSDAAVADVASPVSESQAEMMVRDTPAAERDTADADQDSLQAELDSTTAEADSFTVERYASGALTLTTDLDSSDAELVAVKAELEAVKAELDAVKADRYKMALELDSPNAEHNPSVSDLEFVKAELDDVQSQLELVKAELDDTKAERDAVKAENEKLALEGNASVPTTANQDPVKPGLKMVNADLEAVTAELHAVKSELAEVKAELDTTMAERDAFKGRQEQLDIELDTVKAELFSVKSDFDTVKGELDAVEAAAAEVKAELDKVNTDLDTITSERDEAIADRASVKSQLDDFVAERTARAAELDAAAADAAALKDELDGVQAQLGSVNAELDMVKADNTKVSAELELVKAELDAAKAEQVDPLKTELVLVKSELDSVKSELDLVKAELDKARSEQDTLSAQLAAVEGERDAVQSNLDAAKANLDTARADFDTMKADMDAVKAALDAVSLELDTTKAELDEIRAERDLLRGESVKVVAEQASAFAEVKSLVLERDLLLDQLSQANAEQDRLKAELDAVTADRDRLATELGAVSADSYCLTAELDAATADRDRQAAELAAGTADGSCLTAELAAVAADRNRLIAELDTVTAESNRLHSELDAGTADLARLNAELDSANAARDQLAAAQASISAELKKTIAERDGLLLERDNLISERDTVSASRDELKAQLDALTAELARLGAERDEAAAKHDSMRAERDQALAKWDSTQAEWAKERDALAAEQDTLRDSMQADMDAARAERDDAVMLHSVLMSQQENLANERDLAINALEGLQAEVGGMLREREELRGRLEQLILMCEKRETRLAEQQELLMQKDAELASRSLAHTKGEDVDVFSHGLNRGRSQSPGQRQSPGQSRSRSEGVSPGNSGRPPIAPVKTLEEVVDIKAHEEVGSISERKSDAVHGHALSFSDSIHDDLASLPGEDHGSEPVYNADSPQVGGLSLNELHSSELNSMQRWEVSDLKSRLRDSQHSSDDLARQLSSKQMELDDKHQAYEIASKEIVALKEKIMLMQQQVLALATDSGEVLKAREDECMELRERGSVLLTKHIQSEIGLLLQLQQAHRTLQAWQGANETGEKVGLSVTEHKAEFLHHGVKAVERDEVGPGTWRVDSVEVSSSLRTSLVVGDFPGVTPVAPLTGSSALTESMHVTKSTTGLEQDAATEQGASAGVVSHEQYESVVSQLRESEARCSELESELVEVRAHEAHMMTKCAELEDQMGMLTSESEVHTQEVEEQNQQLRAELEAALGTEKEAAVELDSRVMALQHQVSEQLAERETLRVEKMELQRVGQVILGRHVEREMSLLLQVLSLRQDLEALEPQLASTLTECTSLRAQNAELKLSNISLSSRVAELRGKADSADMHTSADSATANGKAESADVLGKVNSAESRGSSDSVIVNPVFTKNASNLHKSDLMSQLAAANTKVAELERELRESDEQLDQDERERLEFEKERVHHAEVAVKSQSLLTGMIAAETAEVQLTTHELQKVVRHLREVFDAVRAQRAHGMSGNGTVQHAAVGEEDKGEKGELEAEKSEDVEAEVLNEMQRLREKLAGMTAERDELVQEAQGLRERADKVFGHFIERQTSLSLSLMHSQQMPTTFYVASPTHTGPITPKTHSLAGLEPSSVGSGTITGAIMNAVSGGPDDIPSDEAEREMSTAAMPSAGQEGEGDGGEAQQLVALSHIQSLEDLFSQDLANLPCVLREISQGRNIRIIPCPIPLPGGPCSRARI